MTMFGRAEIPEQSVTSALVKETMQTLSGENAYNLPLHSPNHDLLLDFLSVVSIHITESNLSMQAAGHKIVFTLPNV